MARPDESRAIGRGLFHELLRSPDARRRLVKPLLLVLGVFALGTVGYQVLEHWPLLDAFYMTIITLTTVGYGETHPLSVTGRIFTIVLIIVSFGTVGYAVSTLASFLIEGEFNRILRGRTMDKRISKLKDHIILCGSGATGHCVAEELYKTGTPFVVVDSDRAALERIGHLGDIIYLEGDATEDEVLLLAGIKRARGLVTVLSQDRDNVFVVLTARALNPALRIVSRVIEEASGRKLRAAGADETVSPNLIGGLRLASVMIRPSVVTFLDKMLRGSDGTLRVAEVAVVRGSPVAGTALSELDASRRFGLLVLALVSPGKDYAFNPPAETVLREDDTLIVMGTPEQLRSLRDAVAG